MCPHGQRHDQPPPHPTSPSLSPSWSQYLTVQCVSIRYRMTSLVWQVNPNRRPGPRCRQSGVHRSHTCAHSDSRPCPTGETISRHPDASTPTRHPSVCVVEPSPVRFHGIWVSLCPRNNSLSTVVSCDQTNQFHMLSQCESNCQAHIDCPVSWSITFSQSRPPSQTALPPQWRVT